LSGWTVAAEKPEAARNAVQRRRALARIHDKYKAALGVIQYQKDAWPSTVTAATAFPARPRSDPSPCQLRNEKEGTIPPHRLCQRIGICGGEEAQPGGTLSV